MKLILRWAIISIQLLFLCAIPSGRSKANSSFFQIIDSELSTIELQVKRLPTPSERKNALIKYRDEFEEKFKAKAPKKDPELEQYENLLVTLQLLPLEELDGKDCKIRWDRFGRHFLTANKETNFQNKENMKRAKKLFTLLCPLSKN